MKRTSSILAGAALLGFGILVALPSGLGAQTAGGNIKGRVVDAQGAPIPGVTVTATNVGTGVSRVENSDADGLFRLGGLVAGTYNVVAELDGYGTLTQEGVVVNVASTRDLELTLQQSTVQESITVVDEAPLIAMTPSIGTVVSQNELENLPLNGRQFANLAALAPGTTLAYNSDPTKPGQLTIALAGGIGRNINFTMDGGDNTDDTIGGALQNFNLEAVQEFKVQTQQYKAEYGRSSGGVLTVVTKTGTNEFAGSLYGFFRDDSLSSKTQTEKNAGADKQALERKQYGASIGGPIARDKAHFFATYEKTEQDTLYTVNTVSAANPAGTFPGIDGRSFPVPFEDELITAKVTWDMTASQYLQVRYGFQENSDKYGDSPLTHPSALGTLTNEYESVLLGHTSQLGTDVLNEALFQYSTFANLISPDSNSPALAFASGAVSGENINTPQSTFQTKYQYKDDLSWSQQLFGDYHSFKVGANYIHEPELGGDFTTGTAGQYTLAGNSPNSPVTAITITGGFAHFSTPIDQYGIYFQDDWNVSDRLTLNLGLRYDYWDGFDLDQRSNPIWQVLSTQTVFTEPYLRDFQGGRGGVLENDDDNYAPRLGFSWDVKGDGRHVLRGGYGTFYDFPYTNATILFPAEVVQSNYGTAYLHENPNGIRNPDGSLFRPGQPLPPNQLPGLGSNAPNEVASPTLATPYSDQISLAYSVQLNSWLGLNVEALSVDYHDIPYRFRANPRLDANGNPQAARRFAQFGQGGNFRLWYGNGRASYDGVNIGGRVRRGRFEAQGFYTYSKAEGNVLAGADEFRLTNVGYQPDRGNFRDVSINPRDPNCGACFAPLDTDARHRFTVAATVDLPWQMRVSGFARYRSATPYSRINSRGPGGAIADLNRDGFTQDLEPGASLNGERGESFSQVDIRLAKDFTFGDFGLEIIAEVFNIFNEENPAAIDRNGTANAFAGDPLQGEQLLAQLGLRLKWR
jgi:outer membrane receptor protein involved in Fe transport